jgi:flagellin
MSSIMTNASALTALQSLNMTNKNLETTQGRISTGYRIATATDGAAYWSIATTMRSDKSSLAVVQDTLGLGAGKVDTAYSAMTKAIETVNEIKDKLVAATGASSTDKAKLQSEISALQSQLKMGADGATFSGSNWLTLDTTTGTVVAGVADDAKIVAAYTRSAAGTPVLQTIDVDVDSVKLYEAFATATQDQKGILDGRRSGTTGLRDETSTVAVAGTFLATDGFAVSTLTVIGFNDQQIGQMLAVIDTAAKEMTDAATTLGTAKKRIDIQRSATQSLMDSFDRGVGQLVDADMNVESTRLQALQVQQQLGIQALSIANSNAQSILSLFRG